MDESLNFQTRPKGAITFNLNILKTIWPMAKIIYDLLKIWDICDNWKLV